MFDDIDTKYRRPSSRIEPEKLIFELKIVTFVNNFSPQSTTCYAVAFPPFSTSPKHIIYVQILRIAYDSYIDCNNANICEKKSLKLLPTLLKRK